MNRIYISHSKSLDFKKLLYEPLRESVLGADNSFIFPHDDKTAEIDAKKLFEEKKCDLIIAEVSLPATGQGIELGWANDRAIPIVGVYQTGAKISGSLKRVCNNFIEYKDSSDLVNKLEKMLL